MYFVVRYDNIKMYRTNGLIEIHLSKMQKALFINVRRRYVCNA